MGQRFMSSTCRKRKANRQGATLVEFSITCGLAFFFFFAALEFMRVSMFRHTVEHAIYEGARKGIVPGATSQEVQNETLAVLRRVGVQHATVEVTPAQLANDTPQVSVRVRMALDRGLFAPAFFFLGKTLDRTIVMKREGFRF